MVAVYNHPSLSKKKEHTVTHEFYFVMKREGKRYLLAKEINLTVYNVSHKLIGWVNGHHCIDWDSQIVLEPNFDKAAYEERKSNPDFQFKAFSSSFSAKEYVKGKNVNPNKVIWDRDPLMLNQEELASDGRRFKGEVMRFPLLSNLSDNKNNSNIIRTGVFFKASRFPAGIKDLLYAQWNSKPKIFNERWAKFNLDSLDNLGLIYSEVYIPYKIETAQYPLVSFVKVVPEQELAEYIRVFLKKIYSITNSNKRTELYKLYTEIFSKPLSIIGISSIDHLRYIDLISYKEGFISLEEYVPFSFPVDFLIGDLKDERKISNRNIDEIIQYHVSKIAYLERKLRDGKNHEFSYNSGRDHYYWIPLKEFY